MTSQHIIFRKQGQRRRYFPPFQPWGLLHGIAVTLSGVCFWVGVWDILDYAVLPRGWQWRLCAVVLGIAGMYATGTLWRDDSAVPTAAASGAGSAEEDEEEEGEASGTVSGDEEAPQRWGGDPRGNGGGAAAASDDESEVVRLLPPPARAAPHANGGAGGIAMQPLSRRGGSDTPDSSPPSPVPPPHAVSAHGSRRAHWLPMNAFFQRPAFERITFTKYLLSHLAAVAAWTGLWDILDQTVLPALSESCILRAGFLAEYPCVLVKFALVALGAAGLHWTGTLYTIEEDMGAPPGLGAGLAAGAGAGALPWRAQMLHPAGVVERRRRRQLPPPLLAAAAALARLRRKRALRTVARAQAARARRLHAAEADP